MRWSEIQIGQEAKPKANVQLWASFLAFRSSSSLRNSMTSPEQSTRLAALKRGQSLAQVSEPSSAKTVNDVLAGQSKMIQDAILTVSAE